MGGTFDCRSLRSRIRSSLLRIQETNSRPEVSPILLHATSTCGNFFDYVVRHVSPLNRLSSNRYTSVTSCLLCYTTKTHKKPFAASLTGIFPAEDRGLHPYGRPLMDASSEKELCFVSCDPSSYKIEEALTTTPRTRTSYLPRLPFQISADTSVPESLPAPVFSIETPSRPLLRRSHSSSTSKTSSSLYCRSTTESSFSCEPTTMSPMHFADNVNTYSSPLSRYQPTYSPEVPPIPEKWRTANCTRHQSPHPASLRRGLPHTTYWKYESSPSESTSWVTVSPTSSEKRDPSICRYPIFTAPARIPIRPESSASRILDDRIEQRNSYESLRKGGSCRPFSNHHLHETWLDLDDREDPRSTKRGPKKRESRTLVKKRQP